MVSARTHATNVNGHHLNCFLPKTTSLEHSSRKSLLTNQFHHIIHNVMFWILKHIERKKTSKNNLRRKPVKIKQIYQQILSMAGEWMKPWTKWSIPGVSISRGSAELCWTNEHWLASFKLRLVNTSRKACFLFGSFPIVGEVEMGRYEFKMGEQVEIGWGVWKQRAGRPNRNSYVHFFAVLCKIFDI